MDYYDPYSKIVQELQQPPQNEAQTRLWVIDRVLREVLGYAPTEIVPEDTGTTGSRPDYTIMPNTEWTWLLEAKAWNVALTDQHAQQATTYAYQNSIRWVVLSNGQEWRLYDSFVVQDPAQRLVVAAGRNDEQRLEELFSALGREHVAAGGLRASAIRLRLNACLEAELKDANSEVIKAVWGMIKRRPGLDDVSREEVFRAVRLLLDANEPARPEPPSPMPEIVSSLQPTQLSTAAETHSLGDKGSWATNRAPKTISFPDGSSRSVHSWNDAYFEGVCWLGEHGLRPLPVPWSGGGHSRRRIWIDRKNQMADGTPMRAHKVAQVRGEQLFVETHASASYLMELLGRLAEEVGVDPSTLRVTLR